ncbi:MAG: hypothetical protein AAGE01_10215 [Pseudomonadota bacterium]
MTDMTVYTEQQRLHLHRFMQLLAPAADESLSDASLRAEIPDAARDRLGYLENYVATQERQLRRMRELVRTDEAPQRERLLREEIDQLRSALEAKPSVVDLTASGPLGDLVGRFDALEARLEQALESEAAPAPDPDSALAGRFDSLEARITQALDQRARPLAVPTDFDPDGDTDTDAALDLELERQARRRSDEEAADLTARIAGLETRLGDAQEQVEWYRSQGEESRGEIETAQRRARDAGEKLVDTEASLRRVRKSLEEREGENHRLKSILAKQEVSLTETAQRADGFARRVEELEGFEAECQRQAERLAESVEDATASTLRIGELEARVEELEAAAEAAAEEAAAAIEAAAASAAAATEAAEASLADAAAEPDVPVPADAPEAAPVVTVAATPAPASEPAEAEAQRLSDAEIKELLHRETERRERFETNLDQLAAEEFFASIPWQGRHPDISIKVSGDAPEGIAAARNIGQFAVAMAEASALSAAERLATADQD